MTRRIAPILCAVGLLVATGAWAQTEIRGIVSYVDPVTRTVYFTDGRTVQVKPGSTLTINGQPVLLEAVRPGTTVVMLPAGASTTTVTTVTQQTQLQPSPPPPPPVALVPVAPPPAVVSVPAPSPVNVTGTIARTDPLNQTITFQDGRIVRIGPNTMVWQQAPAISTLLPGAQVFVRDALPAGYFPSGAAAPAPGVQYMMGTVSRVDPATQQIVLSNGAVVYVTPTTIVRTGNDRVAVTQLRPGDEIVFQVRNPAMVAAPVTVQPSTGVSVTTTPIPSTADRYVGSALPYQSYADTRIEASDVQVMWSPQAR
jgi:hypothetical protein